MPLFVFFIPLTMGKLLYTRNSFSLCFLLYILFLFFPPYDDDEEEENDDKMMRFLVADQAGFMGHVLL